MSGEMPNEYASSGKEAEGHLEGEEDHLDEEYSDGQVKNVIESGARSSSGGIGQVGFETSQVLIQQHSSSILHCDSPEETFGEDRCEDVENIGPEVPSDCSTEVDDDEEGDKVEEKSHLGEVSSKSHVVSITRNKNETLKFSFKIRTIPLQQQDNCHDVRNKSTAVAMPSSEESSGIVDKGDSKEEHECRICSIDFPSYDDWREHAVFKHIFTKNPYPIVEMNYVDVTSMKRGAGAGAGLRATPTVDIPLAGTETKETLRLTICKNEEKNYVVKKFSVPSESSSVHLSKNKFNNLSHENTSPSDSFLLSSITSSSSNDPRIRGSSRRIKRLQQRSYSSDHPNLVPISGNKENRPSQRRHSYHDKVTPEVEEETIVSTLISLNDPASDLEPQLDPEPPIEVEAPMDIEPPTDLQPPVDLEHPIEVESPIIVEVDPLLEVELPIEVQSPTEAEPGSDLELTIDLEPTKDPEPTKLDSVSTLKMAFEKYPGITIEPLNLSVMTMKRAAESLSISSKFQATDADQVQVEGNDTVDMEGNDADEEEGINLEEDVLEAEKPGASTGSAEEGEEEPEGTEETSANDMISGKVSDGDKVMVDFHAGRNEEENGDNEDTTMRLHGQSQLHHHHHLSPEAKENQVVIVRSKDPSVPSLSPCPPSPPNSPPPTKVNGDGRSKTSDSEGSPALPTTTTPSLNNNCNSSTNNVENSPDSTDSGLHIHLTEETVFEDVSDDETIVRPESVVPSPPAVGAKTSENDDFQCRVCGRNFSSDQEVNNHFSLEHFRVGVSSKILEPESPAVLIQREAAMREAEELQKQQQLQQQQQQQQQQQMQQQQLQQQQQQQQQLQQQQQQQLQQQQQQQQQLQQQQQQQLQQQQQQQQQLQQQQQQQLQQQQQQQQQLQQQQQQQLQQQQQRNRELAVTRQLELENSELDRNRSSLIIRPSPIHPHSGASFRKPEAMKLGQHSTVASQVPSLSPTIRSPATSYELPQQMRSRPNSTTAPSTRPSLIMSPVPSGRQSSEIFPQSLHMALTGPPGVTHRVPQQHSPTMHRSSSSTSSHDMERPSDPNSPQRPKLRPPQGYYCRTDGMMTTTNPTIAHQQPVQHLRQMANVMGPPSQAPRPHNPIAAHQSQQQQQQQQQKHSRNDPMLQQLPPNSSPPVQSHSSLSLQHHHYRNSSLGKRSASTELMMMDGMKQARLENCNVNSSISNNNKRYNDHYLIHPSDQYGAVRVGPSHMAQPVNQSSTSPKVMYLASAPPPSEMSSEKCSPGQQQQQQMMTSSNVSSVRLGDAITLSVCPSSESSITAGSASRSVMMSQSIGGARYGHQAAVTNALAVRGVTVTPASPPLLHEAPLGRNKVQSHSPIIPTTPCSSPTYSVIQRTGASRSPIRSSLSPPSGLNLASSSSSGINAHHHQFAVPRLPAPRSSASAMPPPLSLTVADRPDRPPTVDLTAEDMQHCLANSRGKGISQNELLHSAALLQGSVDAARLRRQQATMSAPPGYRQGPSSQRHIYACAQCNVLFSSEQALDDHKMTTHPHEYQQQQQQQQQQRASSSLQQQQQQQQRIRVSQAEQMCQVQVTRHPNTSSPRGQQQSIRSVSPVRHGERIAKNLFIPLLDLGRLDPMRLKRLEDMGVSFVVPLSGNEANFGHIGIPIMSLRQDGLIAQVPWDNVMPFGPVFTPVQASGSNQQP